MPHATNGDLHRLVPIRVHSIVDEQRTQNDREKKTNNKEEKTNCGKKERKFFNCDDSQMVIF